MGSRGLVKTTDGMHPLAGGDDNDFESVVSECGKEQMTAICVDGEMVEATLDPGQFNAAHKRQSVGLSRRNFDSAGKQQRPTASSGSKNHLALPKVKSSNRVTLSALVQSPTLPASKMV